MCAFLPVTPPHMPARIASGFCVAPSLTCSIGRADLATARARSQPPTACTLAVAAAQNFAMPEKVALVGSGNWGSSIATKMGVNTAACADFDDEIMMWVFEEYVKQEDGKWVRPARGAKPPEGKTWVDEGYSPLTAVINKLHENVRKEPLPRSRLRRRMCMRPSPGAARALPRWLAA